MSETITAEEYLAMGKKKKKSKYKNNKTEVDGIIFDSAREARHYGELNLQVAGGQVASFELQPTIEIVPKCKRQDGSMQRAIKYIGDFKVFYPDGTVQIHDVKGAKTAEFLIKEKLLWALHGIEIVVVK